MDLYQDLGALYNQNFFIADTMNRRLSQIPDKSRYPYLLPNGHSALQLRLPDLLIYLKTDTYLIDIHRGHHYAVYSNRIEKMSMLPKLYSAWEHKQLLQMIQEDALHFGVNSPQPTTGRTSQDIQSTSGQGQPSPVTQTSNSLPSTSHVKCSSNMHFQPICQAHESQVQSMDQALFNLSLNLIDDSPRPQSSGSNPIHTPQPHAPHPVVPPTPKVNQTAVDQHIGAQPAPIPSRFPMGTGTVQQHLPVDVPQCPTSNGLSPLPFVQAPPVSISQLSSTSQLSSFPTDARTKS